MKSTKYQLLKDDFDFACKELKQYRKVIEQQRKQIESLERVKKITDKSYKQLLEQSEKAEILERKYVEVLEQSSDRLGKLIEIQHILDK